MAKSIKRLIPYIIYSIIFLISYLLVISVFVFFHFILGHEFNLIEIWVQENIWTIITISKIISFVFIYQYYRVQDSAIPLAQHYFAHPFEYPLRDFAVVLVFMLFFSVVVLRPQFNEKWSLLAMIVHFIGHSIYFASNFLIVSYLIKKSPFNSRGDIIFTFLGACFIFGLFSYIIIPSKNNFALYFVFEFFLMIFFYHKQKSWVASAWVLLLFNNVLGIIFSLDMFYEEDIGPFRCQGELGIQQMIIAFTLCLLYLWWRGSNLSKGRRV